MPDAMSFAGVTKFVFLLCLLPPLHTPQMKFEYSIYVVLSVSLLAFASSAEIDPTTTGTISGQSDSSIGSPSLLRGGVHRILHNNNSSNGGKSYNIGGNSNSKFQSDEQHGRSYLKGSDSVEY